MAENGSRGASVFLAFVVGALVVAVGALAFFYVDGDSGGGVPEDVNITIEKPADKDAN